MWRREGGTYVAVLIKYLHTHHRFKLHIYVENPKPRVLEPDRIRVHIEKTMEFTKN